MDFETKTHIIKCNKMTPIGNKVLLKKLVKKLDKKYGDIIIPHSVGQNCSLGVAEILDLGNKAKEETNLSIGNYVLYDYYSVYEDKPIYVITNAENIIVVLTKEEADNYVKNNVI